MLDTLTLYVTEEWIDKRIDVFVSQNTDYSRNSVQILLEENKIQVNSSKVSKSYKMKLNDCLTIIIEQAKDVGIEAENIPLDIYYEDDDLLVVNKPKGMVVHPANGNENGTLVNALAWHFRDNPEYDVSDPRMGLVHRIDKDTSGLLVIAKTPDAKTHLGIQFFNKTTKRKYVALVWGAMENE